MSVSIATTYTIYSGTPGAGDWLVDCRLSSINTAVGTLTWTATVNGITVGGAAEVRSKDAGQTTAQAVVPIHCAAAEAVTVTVLSSNSGDTAVTASSTITLQSANAAQIGGTAQTGRDIGASVLLASSQHVIVDSGTIDTYTGNTKQTGDAYALLGTKIPQNIPFTQFGGAGTYYVQAGLTGVMTTALTETATGRLKAAFTALFDQATPLTPTNGKLPATVASGDLALSSANSQAIAAAILDLADGVETGKSLRQALRIIAAVLAGKVSGAGSGVETFKGLDGATDRVRVTADNSGNRTNVVYS